MSWPPARGGTPRTRSPRPGHLRRELTEIRRTGLGYAREELTLGSVSIADPIFAADGSVAAALSTVLRSTRADVRRTEPAVRTAAISASREMRKRATNGQLLVTARRPAS
jgi:DNA-binding IclR family transcriptional regulator